MASSADAYLTTFAEQAATLAENGWLTLSYDHQTLGTSKQETKIETLGVMLGLNSSLNAFIDNFIGVLDSEIEVFLANGHQTWQQIVGLDYKGQNADYFQGQGQSYFHFKAKHQCTFLYLE